MKSARGRTVVAGAAPRSDRSAAAALVVAFLAPALWFAHLNVSYLLVPPACGSSAAWWFGPVTLLALAAMVSGARRSWRSWHDAEASGLVRFLGAFGVAMAALFALTTILVGASVMLVSPCA